MSYINIRENGHFDNALYALALLFVSLWIISYLNSMSLKIIGLSFSHSLYYLFLFNKFCFISIPLLDSKIFTYKRSNPVGKINNRPDISSLI